MSFVFLRHPGGRRINTLGNTRVRPVNGIFKAKEGFGKIDRGAVLTCLPSSSHTTTPSSDASQMPPGGARDDPGLASIPFNES
jgi:hypothetical protein